MQQRYLILEDEPLIAMDLKFAFEDAGVEAVTASSCAEAVREIETGGLAGAVLDVNGSGPVKSRSFSTPAISTGWANSSAASARRSSQSRAQQRTLSPMS
jgi:ActR/RegA family two-component response regulator